MQLVEKIYRITTTFTAIEKHRLVDQMCRAAISIPSNIAEGSKRHTTKEYIRFVAIAQGALAELQTQIIISHRLKYTDGGDYRNLAILTDEIGRLLGGLFVALEKKQG